jgi:predicted Zn-dependent protease
MPQFFIAHQPTHSIPFPFAYYAVMNPLSDSANPNGTVSGNRALTGLLWLVAAWMTALGGSASASNPRDLPSLGDGASSIVSPQMEAQIGSIFLKQLNASLPLSDDVLIQYYVEQHISYLAQFSEMRQPMQAVAVVDNPEINAFAAPGGIIGINLGLLLYARDVNEYSSVIAHEMAHLSQRHFARGIQAQQAASVPAMIGLLSAILVGAAGGTDAGLAAITTAKAISESNQLRFSRSREQEADRIGLSTLVRADIDPNAMARMFERMQQAYRFTRRPPEFLLTHPLSETRISDVRNQARNTGEVKEPDEDMALAYQIARIRAQQNYSTNAALDVLDYRKTLAQDPNNLAQIYGLALALSRNNEHDEAIDQVRRIHRRNPQSVLYTSVLAELLIEGDRFAEVTTLLNKALTLYPDSYPLSMLLAQARVKEQRYGEAENIYLSMSKLRPTDAQVWFELAETAGLAGNVTQVHLARAEYFYLHGASHRTIQHLEYAKNLIAGSNQQLHAKLLQRIQDIRTEIRAAQG